VRNKDVVPTTALECNGPEFRHRRGFGNSSSRIDARALTWDGECVRTGFREGSRICTVMLKVTGSTSTILASFDHFGPEFFGHAGRFISPITRIAASRFVNPSS